MACDLTARMRWCCRSLGVCRQSFVRPGAPERERVPPNIPTTVIHDAWADRHILDALVQPDLVCRLAWAEECTGARNLPLGACLSLTKKYLGT